MYINTKEIERVGESPLTANTEVESQEESMGTERSVKQNRSVQSHTYGVYNTWLQRLRNFRLWIGWFNRRMTVWETYHQRQSWSSRCFSDKNTNTNIQKARRWFLQRFEMVNEAKSLYTSSLFHSGLRRKFSLKTGQGRCHHLVLSFLMICFNLWRNK